MSEISNTFVVVMGVGTVFVGLICIIILCKILSAVCALTAPKETTAAPAVVNTATLSSPQAIENRQEIIAAVSAALAEELGTDISAIRIHSFKKL